MDGETIYQALGEVVPITERKVGSKVSIDEGFGGHPDEEDTQSTLHPLFNHEMTDEDVARSIFNYCDLGKTGLVRASALVDLLLKYASENNEIRETFEDLLLALDPNETDPEITFENFQSSLKLCIKRLTAAEDPDWLLDLSYEFQNQSHQDLNLSSIAQVKSGEILSTPAYGEQSDVKELKFQYSRIQEANNLLQEQMVDVEETNLLLRSENTNLKTKITKVEKIVSEFEQQAKTLQEDNTYLQARLTQKKDDLQRMTVQYDQCQKELDMKVLELEKSQAIQTKGEEHRIHLVETIRQLEEMILKKEEELIEKNKEIQKIAQDLMEQQLLLDPVLPNEYGNRQGQEIGENLAVELQTSCDTPWKKQMESVLKPDFIHPAAWNVMLNEPEYEEEPASRTMSTSSFMGINEGVLNPAVSPESQKVEPQFGDYTNSTPICKVAPKPICWNEEQATVNKETRFSSIAGFSLRVLLFVLVGLTVFTALASVMGILLLFVSAPGCGGVSYYHQQNSPYYSSSFTSKVFDIIKPYCRIEYQGCPPV